MQSPNAETEVHALLRNNPFVPPTGDTCYINDSLPPELLSRIFEVGALDDDDCGAHGWFQRCYEGLEEGYKSGTGNGVESADDEKVEVADQEEEEEEAEEAEAEEEEGDGEEEKVEEEEEEEPEEEGYDEEGDDEEWTDVTGSSDFHSPVPPFQIVVSHVCRHWRNAALSTPSLWTTIKVPFNARPPYENVSILLERSKALPIDIDIFYSQRYDTDSVDGVPSQDDLKLLSSLLIPHVQRWRSTKVQASASSDDSICAFLSAVSDPSVPAASQLATLQLYHHRWRHYGVPCAPLFAPQFLNHFTLFGGSAPNLTKLDLHEVHVDWNQGWIASASNLRYLKLAWHSEEVRPTWTQFATILRGAPQLQTLVLCDSGPSGEPAEWVFEPTPGRPTGDLNAPIQLLKLTHFVLSSYSPSHAIRFLPKFYLPSLKTLTLCLDEGDHADLIDQLAGPATSLSPLSAQEHPRSLLSRLERLKILRLDCRSESIETLYSELQNLHSLHIKPSFLLPEFLNLLSQPCTLPGRGDVWLPRLKFLWISDAYGDTIRQVVQKRKDAGVPLKALYLGPSHVVDDDVEWFKENVETFDFFEESVIQDDDEWSD